MSEDNDYSVAEHLEMNAHSNHGVTAEVPGPT